MARLKIVWICHFTNNEMQSKLPVWKVQNEFAPWIPNVLKGLENNNEIELYVISPHDYLKKQTCFSHNNISYYFIPYGVPFFNRHWPRFFRCDLLTNYASFRRKVKKIVDKVKPNLIHLRGAENAYYSSSILDYKDNYPVLISIQGFIGQMKDSIKQTLEQNKRIEIEEKILREFKYFAGELDSSIYISSFNPEHKIFKMYSSVNEVLVNETSEKEKEYDCVFYGRLCKQKGLEDFIKVIAELKLTMPNVKACVVGPGSSEPYKIFAEELGCLKNIEFAGFINSQRELFEKVKSAKVYLAPPHFERISLTIREAMFLNVPIVAYATGGIPYINEFDENILLINIFDYKAMAEKTLYLLQNEDKRIEFARKAFNYAKQEFSSVINTERLINAYKQIIQETNNN